MDYIVSSAGVFVHARKDWPCAVCRPEGTIESSGAFLCLECAHKMVVNAVARKGDAWSRVSDVADALALLEVESLPPHLAAN